MKYSTTTLKWLSIEIILIMVIYITKHSFELINMETQVRVAAVCGILVLLTTLVMVWRVNSKIDSYGILFTLANVFMFSQHILFLVGVPPYRMILFANRVGSDALYETAFLVLYSLIIMNIGYLFTRLKKHSNKVQTEGREELFRKGLFQAGLLFFIVSLIPTMIVLSQNIYLTFTVGYGERMLNALYKTSGIDNIAGILMGLMVPSLLSLFIARNKEQKWPILVVILYMGLYTLSGSRINTMILLVGILYIQNNLFDRFSFKKILKYMSGLLVIFFVFSVISHARTNINSREDIGRVLSNSVSNTLENNVIVSALSEAGYTFVATATVVENTPTPEPYRYGMSYLSGLTYIFPNGVTGDFYNKVRSTDETFKGYLNTYGSGIGSSFIAEAYWNFGYLSVIVMYIFGILLGKMSLSLDRAIQNRRFDLIFMHAYILITVAFYVRSDTRTFFRNFVWFCVPFLLGSYYFRQYNKQRMV